MSELVRGICCNTFLFPLAKYNSRELEKWGRGCELTYILFSPKNVFSDTISAMGSMKVNSHPKLKFLSWKLRCKCQFWKHRLQGWNSLCSPFIHLKKHGSTKKRMKNRKIWNYIDFETGWIFCKVKMVSLL